MDFLTEQGAGAWRLGVFATVLLGMAAAEALWPRRARRERRTRRWGHHALLAVAGGLVGRLLAPVGAAAAAAVASARGLGALHWLEAPGWLETVIALVVLDFAVWCQHVASHRWAWLWRLHRLHHADVDLDASSGVRFHPVEIALSTLWKAAVVMALGPSVGAVVLFEIVLNAASIFSHSNVAIPLAVDRALRTVLVTPDMHRVHHSLDPVESNRNFGFAIPLWDRLFRTYQAAPAAGHADMVLGTLPAEENP
ncbi:MAG: sterol desaturase family protein [Planctomycetota bacterium]